MRITNVQKKELADIAKSKGLSTSLFITSGGNKIFQIKLKEDVFSFSVEKQLVDRYKIREISISNLNENSAEVSWKGVISRYRIWIENIAKEVKTKTGWREETFENYLEVEYSYESLNERFSKSEKQKISKGLTELKGRVGRLEIPETSITAINQKLDELNQKLDELSKFDWKSSFIGTIISLATTYIIPPEVQGAIFNHIKEVFSFLKKLKE
jgi:hypothetical protein